VRLRQGQSGRRGAELIEACFVFLGFLGLLFLLLNLCWVVFAKASLQHAVREGCRYAVTGQTSGSLGQLASVRQVVQANAMGFLYAASDYSKINITFYRTDTLTPVVGAGSNIGGNLVIISVDGYTIKPLIPLLISSSPLTFSVRAGDKLEASPGGIAPLL
jgi:Flp pilus assembly protein TadG